MSVFIPTKTVRAEHALETIQFNIKELALTSTSGISGRGLSVDTDHWILTLKHFGQSTEPNCASRLTADGLVLSAGDVTVESHQVSWCLEKRQGKFSRVKLIDDKLSGEISGLVVRSADDFHISQIDLRCGVLLPVRLGADKVVHHDQITQFHGARFGIGPITVFRASSLSLNHGSLGFLPPSIGFQNEELLLKPRLFFPLRQRSFLIVEPGFRFASMDTVTPQLTSRLNLNSHTRSNSIRFFMDAQTQGARPQLEFSDNVWSIYADGPLWRGTQSQLPNGFLPFQARVIGAPFLTEFDYQYKTNSWTTLFEQYRQFGYRDDRASRLLSRYELGFFDHRIQLYHQSAMLPSRKPAWMGNTGLRLNLQSKFRYLKLTYGHHLNSLIWSVHNQGVSPRDSMVSNHRADGLRYGTRSLQTLGLNSLWVRRFSSMTHRIEGYSNLNTTWYRGSEPNQIAWTPLIDQTLTSISSGINQELIFEGSTLGLDCAYEIFVDRAIVADHFAQCRTQISSEHLEWDLAWIPDKLWLGRTSVALGEKLQVATLVHAQSAPTNWYEKMYAPPSTLSYTQGYELEWRATATSLSARLWTDESHRRLHATSLGMRWAPSCECWRLDGFVQYERNTGDARTWIALVFDWHKTSPVLPLQHTLDALQRPTSSASQPVQKSVRP